MVRFFTYFLLISVAFSCQKSTSTLPAKIYIHNDNRFSFLGEEFAGESDFTQIFDANDKLQAKGDFAFSQDGKLSELRVKLWSEYYSNGQLKSEGNYQLGSYIQCCFSGPCRQFYHYKVGEWRYYYSNGTLRAIGEYINAKLHIDTSCKGGDSLLFGLISDNWKYYDLDGSQEIIVDSIRKTLEKVQVGDRYLVPNAQQKKIEMEWED